MKQFLRTKFFYALELELFTTRIEKGMDVIWKVAMAYVQSDKNDISFNAWEKFRSFGIVRGLSQSLFKDLLHKLLRKA